jgi:diguanylate cyclase (GGDEF)-like protein
LSLGVMMVDIDHFKQFNETEGHAGGDTLLQRFGEWLPSQVRAEDIVCRYGGDEFLLVLPDTSSEHLIKRGEQLRRAIKQFTLHWQGKQLNVTASIGAAVFPDHGSNCDELMKAADDALYSAKAGGRDRVETPVSSRQNDVQKISEIFCAEQDLLNCKQAGKVLGQLASFGSRICTQGYTNAVENVLPDHRRVGSPTEMVTALAAALTPNIMGLEGALLRKALEETILEAAGLGYELHSLDIAFGLQNFLVRRGVAAFLELFLSLYVFDVVALRIQGSTGLESSPEASLTMSMLALERRCRNVVHYVSKDLGLNARVDELRRNKRLGVTIIRAIEDRLTAEEESEDAGRPPERAKSIENPVGSRQTVKQMNRIS